jgi:DNA polymerase III subunit beta
MRFVCSQAQLSSSLSLCSRAVASRPTHPVLANILFLANKEAQTLSLTAFDLNLGIQVVFPAEVIDSGSITLPSRLLGDIVSRLPNEDITLAVDKDAIASIICGSGKYEVHGLPVEEFPELPQIAEEGQITYLPVESLLLGLDSSLFATSTDESKRVLTGVHITSTSEFLEFAATDGHRLSVIQTKFLEDEVPTKLDNQPNLEVTIPARAMRELERMLKNQKEGVITVKFDRNQMIFVLANQTLTSRLLDGSYPNYNQLIPKQFERQITIEREVFISALERIGVLADQKNNIVKLSLDATGQEISASVDAPDVATGKESILAQISGGDLDIAFNVKYLLDGLKALSSKEIQLKINTATSPAILTPIGSVNMTYLIMPVQIRT